MRRNIGRLLATVGVLAMLVVALERLPGVYWIGNYLVTVKTERTSSRPIKTASVANVYRPAWERAKGNLARIDSDWSTVEVSDGGSFTVKVWSSGQDSGLGWNNCSIREEVLVLKLEYAEGGTGWVAADIPPSQSNREMLVQVP